jgi:hypothetical protein
MNSDPKNKPRNNKWMKSNSTLLIFIISILLSNTICGQEKNDSLLLNLKLNHTFPIPGENDFIINPTEPEFVPESEKRWEKLIFKDKTWTQFQLKEGVKKLPDGRLYLTYTSANQSLHFFTTSDPVSLQFDFHLKPITHWEKLDVYFFGNGMLFNKYLDDGEKFIDLQSKAFFWEIGSGIEYEYKEKKYLFYEYTAGFQNQSFMGKRNKAGVKFKF